MKLTQKQKEVIADNLIREETSPLGSLMSGLASIFYSLAVLNTTLQITTQSLQSAGLLSIQENKPRNFLYTI